MEKETKKMLEKTLTIRYPNGCMTLMLNTWLESATMDKWKRMIKLIQKSCYEGNAKLTELFSWLRSMQEWLEVQSQYDDTKKSQKLLTKCTKLIDYIEEVA